MKLPPSFDAVAVASHGCTLTIGGKKIGPASIKTIQEIALAAGASREQSGATFSMTPTSNRWHDRWQAAPDHPGWFFCDFKLADPIR